jgi:hypothetical protein
MSKKEKVLLELFDVCKKSNNFVFHNNLVKEISKKIGFGNPFDATKLDNIDKIPKIIRDENYTLVHLGNGNHKFIKSLNHLIHQFEPIQNTNEWHYKMSILNTYNSSESNILSVANNQRILHHFLFNEDAEFKNLDIENRPKTYFPHRTKTSFHYKIKDELLELSNIQLEIDLTIEYKGIVGVFEAKNLDFEKISNSKFSVYQLYMPFRYYFEAKKSLMGINQIYCIYLVRSKIEKQDVISLWKYTFEDYEDISSIKFIKSARYNLIKK